MADVRFSSLPAASGVSATDIFPIVQGGVAKKLAFAVLKASANLPVLQDITAAGSITAAVDVVKLVSEATPYSVVLPNATHLKTITIIGYALGSTVTIIPTSAAFTQAIMNLTGQTLTLQFITDKWFVISNNGSTLS